MNDLKQKLAAKIESGEITMIPRWQFVLRATLYGSGVVIAGLISVYLFSFLLFALHKTGVIFAPLYGWSGVVLFIISSPWLVILLLGAFLSILYVLVHHYAFSYKKPLVYSLVAIVLGVIALASMIQQTALHDRIGTFANERNVPALGPLYQQARSGQNDRVLTATILERTESGYVVEAGNGEKIVVTTTDRTRVPRNTVFAAGDPVLVFGERNQNEIMAIGIRPTEERGLERLRESAPRIMEEGKGPLRR